MSYLFEYLRWRIFTGLAMLIASLLILGITGTGRKLIIGQPSASEIELARQQRSDYLAEREIRSARQTSGYDPSDPALVRDGYPQNEEPRYTYDGTEPYPDNPSN